MAVDQGQFRERYTGNRSDPGPWW